MRTDSKVAALSLAIILCGCSKKQENTATAPSDLKRDLAAASAASKDLAVVPSTYQRMRFVSDIEQSHASVAIKRPKAAQHAEHLMASGAGSADATPSVADPIAAMASHQPMAMATAQSTEMQPGIVVAARPAPEATSGPSVPASDGYVEEHGRGGMGAMLGGLIGNVVIRGGRAGDGKCDPRSDAQARGELAGRPNSRMPQPTGGVFSGGGKY